MEEEDVTYLRFFHGGQSLSGCLDTFDQDDIMLLESVKTFVDKKLLMTREEFDDFVTEQEQEVKGAGIKSVFKKFFKRKEEDEKKRKKIASAEDIDGLNTEEELPDINETTFIKLYAEDSIDLEQIKNKIKNL